VDSRDTSGRPVREKTWPERVTASLKGFQGLLEGTAKFFIIVAILGSMVFFGFKADPGKGAEFADRILSWSFVVFSVGLAELFVLFVVLAVLGRIDLPQAFYEKVFESESDESTADQNDGDAATPRKARVRQGGTSRKAGSPAVSLSRLQAFMWTLVIMTVYFHRVVKDQDNGLPTLPPELLMVMGISGAVYLASKGMTVSRTKPPPGGSEPAKPEPAKPNPNPES